MRARTLPRQVCSYGGRVNRIHGNGDMVFRSVEPLWREGFSAKVDGRMTCESAGVSVGEHGGPDLGDLNCRDADFLFTVLTTGSVFFGLWCCV